MNGKQPTRIRDLDPDSIREEFPVCREHVFLNHAAICAPPLRVVKAAEAFLRDVSLQGGRNYTAWTARVEEVRGLAARLLGARAEEIAFTGNTSEGLSAVAEGLSWRPGEGVLIPAQDFPSNVYPWRHLERKGVQVHTYPKEEGLIRAGEVEKALRPGTRLLAASSVDFLTGARADMEALGDFCRRKGLLFCVDAIQSLGVIPLDVKKCGIHFLACGSHKWLLGIPGCAILYVSAEADPLLESSKVGWKSMTDEEDFFTLSLRFKKDARRLEPGTLNLPGIFALGAALELLLEVGIPWIRDRVLWWTGEARKALEQRGLKVVGPGEEESRSGILSFSPQGDPHAVFHGLTSFGIVLSLRRGLVRISPHFYNNEDDLRNFLDAIDRLLGRP